MGMLINLKWIVEYLPINGILIAFVHIRDSSHNVARYRSNVIATMVLVHGVVHVWRMMCKGRKGWPMSMWVCIHVACVGWVVHIGMNAVVILRTGGYTWLASRSSLQ